MTLHLHHFTGCAPAPLAHYLKALGILRIVAEQKDPNARGFWRDEHFCLLTTLDRDQLEAFFLNDYAPTPMLAPWNGGSGFFRTWDKKTKRLRKSKNAAALERLTGSTDRRLLGFQDAHERAVAALRPRLELVNVETIGDDERKKLLIVPDGAGPEFPVATKDDDGKGAVQRAMLEGCSRNPFYGSCIVSAGGFREEGRIVYPSMWGSGGNDGAIDYSGRFFENVGEIIANPQSLEWLRQCLSGGLAGGMLTGGKGKIGQFLPSGAGGANVTTGPGHQNETQLNPWDFVLMLEGAVMFQATVTRRLGTSSASYGAVPFAVDPLAAAHGTPGDESNDRGEQWMPLWARATSFEETQRLLNDGRIQIGRKRATKPIDAARAVARLGVTSGVTAFERFAYLERNGQATLAVAVGRIDVRANRNAGLIDDLAPWMDRLHRLAEKSAPARLVHAERRLADAVFAALTRDDAPSWHAVLRATVDVESIQATGTAYKAGPIPSLSPAWLAAADDGSPEWRLACALGSAAAYYNRKTRRAVDPVRHHWLPLQPGGFRFAESDKRLAQDSRVVMKGRDAVGDLCALVQRRMIEAEQGSKRSVQLESAFGYAAKASDLADLIAGSVDLDAVVTLARALMAIRWSGALPRLRPRQGESGLPDEAWIALRLASLPWPLEDGRKIPTDATMLRRLAAGDGAGAVEVALRRLRASGVRPPLEAAVTDETTARLWAASLAFPISKKTTTRLANHFEFQKNKETR